MIKVELSVHDLVDFILRTGNIDSRIFNITTMQEGSKIHRSYQSLQGEKYIPEYFLKYSFEYGNYLYSISGRCDGIIIGDNGEIIIDEIKSTNIKLEDFFKQNKKWHLSQAEVYALIYCLTEDICKINVRLTYISQQDGRILINNYKYTKNKLLKRVYSYLDKYSAFLDSQKEFDDLKNISLKNMSFPFENFRKGQKEMIDLTYECIKNKDIYFFEASTGIGKTMSLLFGSLEAIRDKKCNKVFYLSAKNSGFEPIINAIKIIYQKGIKIKSIQITSREKICINKNPNKRCNPDDCPFAKDYYTKLYEIIIYSLKKYDIFDKNTILKISNTFKVCPFELSLDLSLRCDFIVCDYNYLYDPTSYLRRFFDDQNSDNGSFILVDEAHNLIDRSRSMYSSSISTYKIDSSMKELNKLKNKKLYHNLLEIKEKIEKYRKNIEENNDVITIEALDPDLLLLISKFKNNYLSFKKKDYLTKTLESDDLSLEFNSFLTIYDFYNSRNYKINIYRRNDSDIEIAINCLDASNYINEISKKQTSTIFFSATLSPISYYKKLLLGDENYKNFKWDSPFEDKNLMVLVKNDVSIKYKDRDLTMGNVLYGIYEFIKNKVGNYIIFSPSFEYLNKLKDLADKSSLFKDYDKYFQTKNMKQVEKDKFLDNFIENPSKTTLAFCVNGGSFSEGIDLISTRLIGVVIIGIGLPSINYENNQLSEYFKSEGLNGFEFTFVNPGINKIMQSVGRVIRGENDRGMALLIDKRYSNKNYQFLFKDIWKNSVFLKNSEDISSEVEKFYKL